MADDSIRYSQLFERKLFQSQPARLVGSCPPHIIELGADKGVNITSFTLVKEISVDIGAKLEIFGDMAALVAR
jgi:hypothetical protein